MLLAALLILALAARQLGHRDRAPAVLSVRR